MGKRERLNVFRYFPYLVLDRMPRSLVALGVGLLLVVPFARGPGDAPAAGLMILALTAACVLVWDGLVSGDRRGGTARILFARPVQRAAYYAGAHAAAILCLVAVSFLLGCATGILGSEGPDSTAALPISAVARLTVLAGLLAAGVAGSLTFALSALLPRGDGIAATAALLAAVVLPRIVDGTPFAAVIEGLVARALPPVTRMTEIQVALLSGAEVTPGAVAGVAAWCIAVLAMGMWVAVTKDLEPPG